MRAIIIYLSPSETKTASMQNIKIKLSKRCFLRKADISFAGHSGKVEILPKCQIPAYLKI